MGFNIIQFFDNLFGIGKPTTTAPHPSTLQSAVDTAGKALDEAENIVNTLQGLASVLPTAFQGYLAAFALAMHSLDSYVDTIETATPATGAVPQPILDNTTVLEPPVVEAVQAQTSKKTA